MWNFLLFHKWLAYNFIGFAALFVFSDFVLKIFVFDPYVSPFIFLLYFIFFAIGTYRVLAISRSINDIRNGIIDDELKVSRESLEYKLFSKISFLNFLSNLPTKMGLLGTVFGLITISLGLPELLSGAGDVKDLIPIFAQFLTGAMIAFVSTAVGITIDIWLDFLMVIVKNGVGTQIELLTKDNDETV